MSKTNNVESEVKQLCVTNLKTVQGTAKFSNLRVLAHLQSCAKHRTFVANHIGGNREPLNEILKENEMNDAFTLNDLNSSEQKKRIHYRGCNNNKLALLDCIHERHCLYDVSLVTEIGTYNAHRKVLASYSEYFRAMFASNMLESNMESIVLRDIDGFAFRRMLDYIYSGQIHISGCDDAMNLLQVSVYFQISSMINHCCAFLKTNMTTESACLIALVARDFALTHLLASAHDHLIDHFFEMDSRESNVVLLNADDVIECLQSDLLVEESNSATELAVLRIVLRWHLCNHNSPEGKQHQVFSQVRFPLIRADDIMNACRQIIADEQRLHEKTANDFKEAFTTKSYGPVFRCYLLRGLQYHQQIYKQPLIQSRTTELRTSRHSLVSVDGVLASSPVKLSSGFRHESRAWSKSKRSAIRDPFHSVVECNGFLFVLGGTRQIDEGYSNHVMRYDPRLDTWCRVASMHERRGDFVALLYRDKIYVFGGRNKNGALKTCECYDLETNTWKYIASLPEPLYMSAGVVTNEAMILCGGFNDFEATGKTLCYDPSRDRWERLHSSLLFDRGYHAMIEGVDGQLWVVGGVDHPFSGRNVWQVETFDKSRKTWKLTSQVLPLPPFLSALRLNIFNDDGGHICVFAVTSPKKYYFLQFDIQKNVWTEVKPHSCVNFNVDYQFFENNCSESLGMNLL